MSIRKIFAIILFAIAFISNTPAQNTNDFTIEIEKRFKNDKREIPIDFIGGDENGYYLLYAGGRFGQGKKSIRKFSLDLEPAGKEILLGDNENVRANSLGISKVGDKIIHIWYVTSETGKKYYYQTVDLDNFSLGKATFITEIKNDSKKVSKSISKFLISNDEKSIVLFYTIPNKKNEFLKIRVQKFDTNFNELSSNEYEFNYNNSTLNLHDISFDKNNELIIICKKDADNKPIKPGYEYLIYRASNNNLKLVTEIKPENVHLRSLSTIVNDDNILYLTGLFAKKSMYNMLGVFNAKVDLNTGKTMYKKYHKHSESFFTKLIDPKSKKIARVKKRLAKEKHEDLYYILKDYYLNKNNEQLILAEQIHTISNNYVTTYYHQNLALIKIDKNGEVIWSTKIGKNNQKRNVPIYSSYFPVIKNDNLFLFYNCNEMNLNHKTGTVTNSFHPGGKWAFIANKVNLNDGNYAREKLADKKQLNGITIRPSLYNWIDEKTLLMFGQDIDNLKNQGFIKIKFN